MRERNLLRILSLAVAGVAVCFVAGCGSSKEESESTTKMQTSKEGTEAKVVSEMDKSKSKAEETAKTSEQKAETKKEEKAAQPTEKTEPAKKESKPAEKKEQSKEPDDVLHGFEIGLQELMRLDRYGRGWKAFLS